MNGAPANVSGLLEGLKDKRVLVTGGTGSFGRTLVELCLEQSQAREIVVFSRDEQKHVALRRALPDERLRLFVGDIRDVERLRLAMRGIDLVFNAAAIKHVPLTEQHPMEAVQTNILGCYNVCQIALEAGVEALVSLSTDKAVEPVNVMGMTKALHERVVASFAGQGLRVAIVRYGNVLASNGSVVPYFAQLIESGASELPVTDRRMTRFCLTLQESVYLVLHALTRGEDGSTYVLDLPAFRIWDLAEVMAEAAARPDQPIRVRETGIRPGEKLHESLISAEEMRRTTREGSVFRIARYRSGDEKFPPARTEKSLSSDAAQSLTKPQIVDLLRANGLLPRPFHL